MRRRRRRRMTRSVTLLLVVVVQQPSQQPGQQLACLLAWRIEVDMARTTEEDYGGLRKTEED